MRKHYVNIIDNSELNEPINGMEPLMCDIPPSHTIIIGNLSFMEKWLYKLFKIKPKNKLMFEDVFGVPNANIPNANGRIYPSDIISDTIDRYNDIKIKGEDSYE